jgi:hypothetical protein
MRLQKYKFFISESAKDDQMAILKELSLDLSDVGLDVKISDRDTRWEEVRGGIFVVITDKDKIFCPRWPDDGLDWLWGKSIITTFIEKLKDFGLKYDRHYRVYAGGLSVTLAFTSEGRKSIHL